MIQRWLPFLLLAIFTMISILALSEMARNIAQKRTVFGDPLCKVVWQKTHQAGQDPSHVRTLVEGIESQRLMHSHL